MHTGFFSSVDFARDGKQSGTVNFPYSIDRSPYYQIRVPICRIRNGEGPSILLIAGNHGDEYEGPIALAHLIQAIEPENIRGAITIVPALNAPAVDAHRRCSPFDGGNLNRSFPGDSTGTPTSRIASYVTQDLIPRHDVMFDLHSGGTSMDHLHCGIVELTGDDKRDAEACDLLHAMGLPYAFLANNGPDTPTSLGAGNRAGKIAISGEFGGGASLTPASIRSVSVAIDGVLVRLGILQEPLLTETSTVGHETEFLRLDGQDLFVYSDEGGWFEPFAAVGERVESGQLAARVYDLFAPNRSPRLLHFQTGGIVIAKRLHTHVQSGDCLFALGRLGQ
jgi:predicted deacylase